MGTSPRHAARAKPWSIAGALRSADARLRTVAGVCVGKSERIFTRTLAPPPRRTSSHPLPRRRPASVEIAAIAAREAHTHVDSVSRATVSGRERSDGVPGRRIEPLADSRCAVWHLGALGRPRRHGHPCAHRCGGAIPRATLVLRATHPMRPSMCSPHAPTRTHTNPQASPGSCPSRCRAPT